MVSWSGTSQPTSRSGGAMEDQNAIQVYQRITSLETKISQLEDVIQRQNNVIKSLIHKDSELPNLGLLNDNFLYRAFSVYGLYFVAQLIVGLVFGLLFFCGTLAKLY